MQPKLNIVKSILSDPPSYKVGCTQQHSIIKWKWNLCDCAWAGHSGTSKLHKKVDQMPMVPTLSTLPSLFQPAPMISWKKTQQKQLTPIWSQHVISETLPPKSFCSEPPRGSEYIGQEPNSFTTKSCSQFGLFFWVRRTYRWSFTSVWNLKDNHPQLASPNGSSVCLYIYSHLMSVISYRISVLILNGSPTTYFLETLLSVKMGSFNISHGSLTELTGVEYLLFSLLMNIVFPICIFI